MSAQEIIEQIKELSAVERAQVTKFIVESDDCWIPESFKRGMADADAGRFADMETVLSGVTPSDLATKLDRKKAFEMLRAIGHVDLPARK